MTVLVRDATPQDAETLAALLIASKEASFPHLVDAHDRNVPFWVDRWRRYLTEGSRAQCSRSDGFALIGDVDGQPAGFAAYHHTTRHGTDGELQALYVLKAMQGQGLGTQLLRILAARFYADGSRSMCVGYDPRNPYKCFYLKHGAVEVDPHWAVWGDLGRLAAPLNSSSVVTL